MTIPESRTVEERLIEAIHDAGPFEQDGGVPDICNRWPEHQQLARAILAAAKEHGLVIGEGELDVERLIEAAWKSGILTGSQQQGERAVRILAAYYLGHGDHPMDGYRYDGCPACAALKGVALASRR